MSGTRTRVCVCVIATGTNREKMVMGVFLKCRYVIGLFVLFSCMYHIYLVVSLASHGFLSMVHPSAGPSRLEIK